MITVFTLSFNVWRVRRVTKERRERILPKFTVKCSERVERENFVALPRNVVTEKTRKRAEIRKYGARTGKRRVQSW